MQNFEYTNQTNHGFHTDLCDICDNMNYVGNAPSATVEKALSCGTATNKWVQLFVPKIMDIPLQKPSMEGIISVNSCIDIFSQKVIQTPTVTGYTNAAGVFIPGETIPNSECTFLTGKKLIIEGMLTQKVIYTALTADQAVHSATFFVPFSTFIIVENETLLSQDFKITSYLEDTFVCAISERTLFSNNTIFIKAVSVC